MKDILKLLTKKGAILYDVFHYGNKLSEIKEFPSIEMFNSKLKSNVSISNDLYENFRDIWTTYRCSSMEDLNYLYNMVDVVLLNVICKSRFSLLKEMMGFEPKNFSSLATFSKASQYLFNKSVSTTPKLADVCIAFEKAIIGGFAATPMRLSFDSKIFSGREEKGLWVTINGKKHRVYSKILKFDENNQYGFAMTKKLPYGCVRKQIVAKDERVATEELNNILNRYKSYDVVGHLFCVDLSPPASDHEVQLCEGYLPLFLKEKLDPRFLSTYQHKSKKEKSAVTVRDKNVEQYKVIASTEKTHVLLKKRGQVYVFVKNLLYLVN